MGDDRKTHAAKPRSGEAVAHNCSGPEPGRDSRVTLDRVAKTRLYLRHFRQRWDFHRKQCHSHTQSEMTTTRKSEGWRRSKTIRLPGSKIVRSVIKGIFPESVLEEGDDEFPINKLGVSARCAKHVDATCLRHKYAISKVQKDGTEIKVMTILWTAGKTTVFSDKTGNSLEKLSSDDPLHKICARNLFPQVDSRVIGLNEFGALYGPSDRFPLPLSGPLSTEFGMKYVLILFPELDRAQCPDNFYKLPVETLIHCLLQIYPPSQHYESSVCPLHNKKSIHRYTLWKGKLQLMEITCIGKDGPALMTYCWNPLPELAVGTLSWH